MEDKNNDRRISRRTFAKAGIGAAVLAASGTLLTRSTRAGHHESEGVAEKTSPKLELVTDVAANAGVLAAVQYVANFGQGLKVSKVLTSVFAYPVMSIRDSRASGTEV